MLKVKSLPLEGKVGCGATRMRWKSNYDCFRNLHLTTACGGASPQGEAFERFASKSYASQYGYVEFEVIIK